jgi:carbamoyl-phosphate synthase large subunit
MMDRANILVLGVGGNVSQGIVKTLALSRLPCRVVGACLDAGSAGLYAVDKAYISPPADRPEFLDWLLATCRRERIHGILTGVEPVLACLAQHAESIRQQTGAIVITSRPEQLAICNDKLATSRWLQSHGFNYPSTAECRQTTDVQQLVQQHGFPLLGKPRHGKGSHGITIIRDARDLELVQHHCDYVIQPYLGSDDEEYTASTFTDRHGIRQGTIVLKRSLQQGTTLHCEAGEFADVRREVDRIVDTLKPVGPCNVQLRLAAGKAVCFEINLRFSGTVSIRAHLGFNDVEASVRHFILGQPAEQLPEIYEGVALRYWNEIYLRGGPAKSLTTEGVLDQPHSAVREVEDFGLRGRLRHAG